MFLANAKGKGEKCQAHGQTAIVTEEMLCWFELHHCSTNSVGIKSFYQCKNRTLATQVIAFTELAVYILRLWLSPDPSQRGLFHTGNWFIYIYIYIVLEFNQKTEVGSWTKGIKITRFPGTPKLPQLPPLLCLCGSSLWPIWIVMDCDVYGFVPSWSLKHDVMQVYFPTCVGASAARTSHAWCDVASSHSFDADKIDANRWPSLPVFRWKTPTRECCRQ